MKREEERYVLENLSKKSVKQIASDLNVKERLVRRFLEQHRPKTSSTETSLTLQSVHFPPLLIFLLMAALGFLIYSNTLHSSFQWDDVEVIVQNTAITHWTDFGKIWHSFCVRFVTGLSFALNYAVGKLNPFGYHFLNTLIHVFCSWAVYVLVLLTFRTPTMQTSPARPHSEQIALGVAFLFLTHPIQTESVTYIWQRATSLAGLFYISSLLLYVSARLNQKPLHYVASLASAVLGMFTKEITFTLPFSIAIYEFFFLHELKVSMPKRSALLVPFFLFLLFYPISIRFSNPDMQTLSDARIVDQSQYLLTQPNVIRTYLRLLFVPINQNLDYDYPETSSLMEASALFSLLIIAGLMGCAYRFFFTHRLVAFGIVWFFLLLSIESLVPLPDVIFEHRLYIATAGFSIALVYLLFLLIKNPKHAIALLVAVIFVFCVATYRRNEVWKTPITLWKDTIRKSPKKGRCYIVLGDAYKQMGQKTEAIHYYEQANLYYSGDLAFLKMGEIMVEEGKVDRAIELYQKAIEVDPQRPRAHNLLANLFFSEKNYEQAARYFQEAVKLRPYDAMNHSNLGSALTLLGRHEEAIQELQKAIEIRPHYAVAYYNLGNAKASIGDKESAIQNYIRAIQLRPNYVEAYLNLSKIYKSDGRIDESERAYQKAVELNPDLEKVSS